MSTNYQNILLVDHIPEAIDYLLNSFDDDKLPAVKISTAYCTHYALELLNENEFSLLIVGLKNSDALAAFEVLAQTHWPKPAVAILPESMQGEVITTLRLGAADVFIRGAECFIKGAFSQSVIANLHKASLIEQNAHYQAALEKSLAELRTDQQAARQIQQNMLPQPSLTCGDITAQHLLIPSLYLSGDFVDVVAIDQQYTMFYLADVSGHGASSALVTVLLKSMANRLKRSIVAGSNLELLSPAKALKRINRELLDTKLGKHLSIFLGFYDHVQQRLIYAVGGHHPMPILSYQGGVDFIQGRGMPVGLFPEPVFEEKTLNLEGEFCLTLFSDGILEVLAGDSMSAKEEQLLMAVSETKAAGPEALKDYLLPAIIDDAPDDIAILTIHRQ